MVDLVGVSELARRLQVGKGTLSKQAAAGKIPIATRDENGYPLFDVEAVRTARTYNLNPLMKRDGHTPREETAPSGIPPGGGDDAAAEASTERRSGAAGPRPPSALVEQQKLEKQLKNRRLFRQLAEDESLLVLGSVVDSDQTTMARRTRDAVTAFLADKASAAYAFAGQPRTESEWRVWLGERAREAFNHFASTLALEDDDEFEDAGAVDGDPGAAEPAADP